MPLDLTNKYAGLYVPEDNNQALVQTPYGRGMVIRSRKDEKSGRVTMREIELLDWVKPESSSERRQRPSVLFSPTAYPSVKAEVGNDVCTICGRGKVVDIREDGVLEVRISSWRLARRSLVTCFLAPNAVQVIRPYKIYEMSVFEKVEHAEELKVHANEKFSSKSYKEALELYAMAVDTVRYVQHKSDSPNELRADLLVVMITCCNNAATCCLQLHEWDRAQKFGKNALVLIDALYEKKGNSKIHDLLNREGTGDSKLFGAWKVKSYLVIARGQAERHESLEAIEYLKHALKAIDTYKIEGDPTFKQLQSHEKEVRKLLSVCKERLKAEHKKEKLRARAMFGGSEEKKDSDKKEAPTSTESSFEETDLPDKKDSKATNPSKAAALYTSQAKSSVATKRGLKKKVSFADGSTPGSVDDDAVPSFWDEHKEALVIVAGFVLGSLLVHMLFPRRR